MRVQGLDLLGPPLSNAPADARHTCMDAALLFSESATAKAATRSSGCNASFSSNHTLAQQQRLTELVLQLHSKMPTR